jgi:hypothetical protein
VDFFTGKNSMEKFRIDGFNVVFDYSNIGVKTNQTYMGTFCVKGRMSPLDIIKADRLHRELLGNINPHLATREAQDYAFALSQLNFRITGEIPEFFKCQELNGGHLDNEVLIELINLAIEAEDFYQKHQVEKIQKMQEQLTKQIKNNKIKPKNSENEESESEEIPEIDLGSPDIG